jgi:hypothetical protein
MARWRVFYANGSIYDSLEYAPNEIPGVGVIVIVQEHEDPQERPYLQHMTDYYIWLGDRWRGCDLFGFWQYIFIDKHDFSKAALAGQTVSNRDFVEIGKSARALRDQWYGSSHV